MIVRGAGVRQVRAAEILDGKRIYRSLFSGCFRDVRGANGSIWGHQRARRAPPAGKQAEATPEQRASVAGAAPAVASCQRAGSIGGSGQSGFAAGNHRQRGGKMREAFHYVTLRRE